MNKFARLIYNLKSMFNLTINIDDRFKQVLNYFHALILKYFNDQDFKNCLITADTKFLSVECVDSLSNDDRFKFLFNEDIFNVWTLTEEFMEHETAFYSADNFNVSKRAKLSLESTNIYDLYLYDNMNLQQDSKVEIWASNIYSKFIEDLNETLTIQNQPLLKLNEK